MTLPREAVPFLASALLAGIGAIASYGVSKRAPDLLRRLDEKYGGEVQDAANTSRQIPPHRTPDGIGKICTWAADCAQSAVALAGPPVAALLLASATSPLLGLAYLAVGVLGAAVFVRLLNADPDRYVQRTKFGVTPVAALAVGLNLVLALAVALAS